MTRRRGRLGAPALLLVLTGGCAGSEPRTAPWQEEARVLLDQGQPVEALAVYRQAAAGGSSPDAELEAARLLLSHQKVGWALVSLRALVARFPADPRVLELHYQAAILNRLFDEALTTGRRLLESRSDDPRLLRHVGILELKAGRIEPSVEALRSSAALDEDSPATWYALGRALEAGYRDAEAVAAYRRRLELGPEDTDARWRLARLLVRDDRGLREAEALVAELAAGADPPTRILHLAGTVQMRLGRVEDGQRTLSQHQERAAVETRLEHDHLRYNVLLDRVVVALGRAAAVEAERLLAEVAQLSLSTLDERVELLRAVSLLAQGKTTAGLQELSGVVAARPQAWRYRYLRAEGLAALGLRREALAELDIVERLQPFAIEARRLRLELLPEDGPAREREGRRLEVLRAVGDASEETATDEATGRTRLLFDAVQLHPRARLPEPDVIPMD